MTNRLFVRARRISVFSIIAVDLLVPTASVSAGAESEQPKTFEWQTPTAFEMETGRTLPSYSESPMLSQLVADGVLPTLEERLPLDVVVLAPRERVGLYSGDHTLLAAGFVCCNDYATGFSEYSDPSNNLQTIVVDTSYDDVATISLRPGLKWSNGVPVDADDVLFSWVDFIAHEDLLSIGGFEEMFELTKIDDHTLLINFDNSSPSAARNALTLLFENQSGLIRVLPKHYYSELHANYNEDAELRATQAGFQSWQDYFLASLKNTMSVDDSQPPTLAPWTLAPAHDGTTRLTRNPYYAKVDTEGQQLPYIDAMTIIQSDEITSVDEISGTLSSRRIHLELWNWNRPSDTSAKKHFFFSSLRNSTPLVTMSVWESLADDVVWFPNVSWLDTRSPEQLFISPLSTRSRLVTQTAELQALRDGIAPRVAVEFGIDDILRGVKRIVSASPNELVLAHTSNHVTVIIQIGERWRSQGVRESDRPPLESATRTIMGTADVLEAGGSGVYRVSIPVYEGDGHKHLKRVYKIPFVDYYYGKCGEASPVERLSSPAKGTVVWGEWYFWAVEPESKEVISTDVEPEFVDRDIEIPLYIGAGTNKCATKSS